MAVETQASKNRWLPDFASGARTLAKAEPACVGEEGYYGQPMLKRPLWHWHIALYFFLEGVSAGAYVIAAISDLVAHDRHRELRKVARYLSLAALAPCPPLLVADLGRPERFHHMLRVWKWSSPMNTGAWALSAYSLPVGLLAFKQLAGDAPLSKTPLKKTGSLVPARAVAALGLPPALTMVSYPGVLLSTTSSPVWSHTRFLGPLIAASSMSTGAALLTLLLSARGEGKDGASLKALEQVERAASLCEACALAAYLYTAGRTAEPLTKGRQSKLFWLGAVGAGLALPALVKAAAPRKKGRAAALVSSALKLAGGLALKWALVYAGRDSAEEALYARHATRPTEDAPGWYRSP